MKRRNQSHRSQPFLRKVGRKDDASRVMLKDGTSDVLHKLKALRLMVMLKVELKKRLKFLEALTGSVTRCSHILVEDRSFSFIDTLTNLYPVEDRTEKMKPYHEDLSLCLIYIQLKIAEKTAFDEAEKKREEEESKDALTADSDVKRHCKQQQRRER
ncbi:hypothetical protein DY000_02020838 [Brassica cretica]|uniref:Uncharacterized protein n=1 Tax=Brassica cretica TaxID=69181 RepID=A0ABQ7EB56_BRACR|nr:hypothetical protein DY000_02020838 [Brassica cretica]